MKITKIIIAVFLPLLVANTYGYNYEKRLADSHLIHILYMNPNEFEAEIVKANNGVGRETLSSIAKRFHADIAINAGFFEIGNDKDGAPSCTLVINGKVYNLKKDIQPLVIIKNGTISIDQLNPMNYENFNLSLVSGIPMLIDRGEILSALSDKKSEFYTQPHARTALGIDSSGKVIIVVAEHVYTKDILSVTMGELQSLLKEKGNIFAEKYKKQNSGDITLDELKQILRDEFSSKNTAVKGVTILELAKLMKDLKCEYAINLDGGGSSTLWVDGKVINNTFGDKDEAIGEKIERPISDAIIFKKRQN